jgi:hypothetical protein
MSDEVVWGNEAERDAFCEHLKGKCYEPKQVDMQITIEPQKECEDVCQEDYEPIEVGSVK